MNIVFCADEKYELLTKVSIESYRKYNPNAKIILVSETPMKNIGYDENIIIKLPKMFRNNGERDRISNTAYLKLFLTQLPYRKIIYVDGDTLCQKPLDDLWNIPCAYINLCEGYMFSKKQAQAIHADRYGLTGMMVMNLENLRRLNFTEKCLEVEHSYPTPITGWQHDETCINVAMRDKLNFIDQKYNYCHKRCYPNPIPEDDAYILHFVGKDKTEMFREYKYGTILPIGEDITGKRVAIVGNAKSIFGKGQGEKIDDHDFIIRFNKGFLYQPIDQGSKTTLLILACMPSKEEIEGFHAKYVCNRSISSKNEGYTIGTNERMMLKEELGAQPSSGFMAIDICLHFKAKSIDLYGFDFEETPTFYNPVNYKTQHNYANEKRIILKYQRKGLLKIH